MALAAALGPSTLGTWSLPRVAARYLVVAGLGVPRGLEVEWAAHREERGGERYFVAERYAAAGKAILLLGYGASTGIALILACPVTNPTWRVILAGVATTADVVLAVRASICRQARAADGRQVCRGPGDRRLTLQPH